MKSAMMRYLVLLLVFAGIAGIVPHYLDLYQQTATPAPHPQAGNGPVASASELSQEKALPQASYLGNGKVATLTPDAEGHFAPNFIS